MRSSYDVCVCAHSLEGTAGPRVQVLINHHESSDLDVLISFHTERGKDRLGASQLRVKPDMEAKVGMTCHCRGSDMSFQRVQQRQYELQECNDNTL